MKFSIIGTGFILPVHVQAIRDIDGEIRDIVNDVHGENEWKKMVKSTDADCVVILTPNDLHFEMAVAIAKEGKIVLCEKPLVVKSGQARILAKKPNIFTALQLRHHPLAKKIKSEIKENEKYEIKMDISVYRDEKYYKGWKGQKEKSGGPLFNLGIHYFDLLLYFFGRAEELKTTFFDEKTGEGKISGKNYICNWRISTGEKRETQRRVFKINGKNYNFSSKDNLSFENLHKFVYQDLLNKKGVTPLEALKSIELIEQLHSF